MKITVKHPGRNTASERPRIILDGNDITKHVALFQLQFGLGETTVSLELVNVEVVEETDNVSK